MIAYLVTDRHRYTVEGYLHRWMPSLQSRVAVMPYERLEPDDGHHRAAYVFSDLDRLTGATRLRAVEMHRRLSETEASPPILNDPARSLVRFGLLRALKERGMNEFDAYRLSERRTPDRFPVFLRLEDGHSGSLTPLLHDQHELDRAIVRLCLRGRRLSGTLMIEFCDTSDREGVFRKYGAFIVGSRIVPKHMMFSRDWCVKGSDLVTEDRVAEETRYVEANPHEDDLRDLFAAAGIAYGRADYGVVDGRIQVWEINTNPVILSLREPRRERRHLKELFSERIARAFEAIDTHGAAPAKASQTGRPPQVRQPGAWRALRWTLAARPRLRSAYRRARRPLLRLGNWAADGASRLLRRPVIALLRRLVWSGREGRAAATRRPG